MKLYEYEAKAILGKNGIVTPKGQVAFTPQQAREIAANLASAVAVKAQVLVAGRGKAGGIQFVQTPDEAAKAAGTLFATTIKDESVKIVLVEQKIPIKKELYFAVTVDRLSRRYVVVASKYGGTEIEETVKKNQKEMLRHLVNPKLGFCSFHARQIAQQLGYNGNQLVQLAEVLKKTFVVAIDCDAELLEINPLVQTEEGNFVAVDARIIVDENALFRQEQFRLNRLEQQRELSAEEFDAQKSGLSFVKLGGDIGVVGNGAGLVMATLDLVSAFGGEPANFIDIGGGAPQERVSAAFRVVLSNSRVKVLLVNILGGITLCDEVARAIVETRKQLGFSTPVVVRLVGTNEQEGKGILAEAQIPTCDSMEEAARQAVKLAKEAV